MQQGLYNIQHLAAIINQYRSFEASQVGGTHLCNIYSTICKLVTLILGVSSNGMFYEKVLW